MAKKKLAEKRTCLLVLGMHRSGTSALTRVLNIMGAKLPATLMGASSGNNTGHWESNAFYNYHDSILAEIGSAWNDWRFLDVKRLPLRRRNEIKTEIRDIIEAEYGTAPLIVLKDPRICRFAPLFIEVLTEANFDIRTIQIFRNPLEVCESLEERDGMFRADAALLWLRYVLDAEFASRKTKRIIISYTQLLDDWKTVVEKISTEFELKGTHTIAEISPQVDEYLSPKHRHHVHKTEDVLLDPMLRDWVGAAYEELLVLARNPKSRKAKSRLDNILGEFNRAGPVLHKLNNAVRTERDGEIKGLKSSLSEMEDRAAELAVSRGEIENQCAKLTTVLEQRAEELKQLGEVASQANAKVAEQAAVLEQREQEVTGLREKLSQAEELKAALAAAEGNAAKLAERFAQSEGEAGQLEATLVQRSSEIAELKKALDDWQAKTADLEVVRGDQEQDIAYLEVALAKVKGQLMSLENSFSKERESLTRSLQDKAATLEAEQGKVEELQNQLSTLLSEGQKTKVELLLTRKRVQTIRNSLSWKITAPLRALRAVLKRTGNSKPNHQKDHTINLNSNGSAGEALVNSSEVETQFSREHLLDLMKEFDKEFYLSSNTDVANSKMDPFEHYINFGLDEGRKPNNNDEDVNDKIDASVTS